MFCGKCGEARRDGDNFCRKCGEKFVLEEASDEPSWRDSLDYVRVINAPDVKKELAFIQSKATDATTTEEMIGLISPVLSAAGVSKNVLSVGSKLSFGLYDKVGLIAELTEERPYEEPTGLCLAAVACFLAQKRNDVMDALHLEDQCVIEALVPMGWTTAEVRLYISVRQAEHGSEVSIDARVPKATWGIGFLKSRMDRQLRDILSDSFQEIERFLRRFGN